ncbi:guanine deaminase, partial [bacterium]|nr:guanine deaminase [bacterium]
GLGSGLFDFKKAQRAKVRWALGSDIGGGPILSMLDVMRSFVQQNRKSGQRGASYVQALYRATGAGASILGVGDRAGNFRKGKDASFVVLEIPSLKGIQSAEQALAAVIEPLSKKRDAYDLLPRAVSLRGRLSWNRP